MTLHVVINQKTTTFVTRYHHGDTEASSYSASTLSSRHAGPAAGRPGYVIPRSQGGRPAAGRGLTSLKPELLAAAPGKPALHPDAHTQVRIPVTLHQLSAPSHKQASNQTARTLRCEWGQEHHGCHPQLFVPWGMTGDLRPVPRPVTMQF